MVLAQKQTHRSMEKDRKPRNNPTQCWQLIYNKKGKNIQRKTVSSVSGPGKTGQLHVKEWNSLIPYTKTNSKWIQDINVRPDTIKLLEKSIGRSLSDINHSNIFLDLSPKVKEMKAKISKWDLIKSFCTAKETTNKTNRQPTEWEKIFANDMINKGLISNIYKQLISLNIKKKLKNGQKNWIDIFPKRKSREPTGTWKHAQSH